MPVTRFDRVRRGVDLLRAEGPRGLARRGARLAYRSLGSSILEFPLLEGDIADSTTVVPARPGPLLGTAPVLGWLMTPPSLGSGGHTTLLRMVREVEEAGIRCVLYLYDRHGGDLARHEREVREGWPWIRADVVSADGGISDVDACFATSWDTAHVLARRAASHVRRLYFIQDYEPYFFPHGSEYALAEDSYRLGFRNVGLGSMVTAAVQEEAGAACELVPFGCDTQTYRYEPGPARTGIVFYSKPDVARRGYTHVRLAIEEFHERHPEQEIHAYGENVVNIEAPVTWHGRLWPDELRELYNRTLGGLTLSFTNISLIPGEMLACGSIPVVNDSAHARAVLENPHIAWARPTPHALADALCEVVEHPEPELRAKTAAASMTVGWKQTQSEVLRIVRDELGIA